METILALVQIFIWTAVLLVYVTPCKVKNLSKFLAESRTSNKKL